MQTLNQKLQKALKEDKGFFTLTVVFLPIPNPLKRASELTVEEFAKAVKDSKALDADIKAKLLRLLKPTTAERAWLTTKTGIPL